MFMLEVTPFQFLISFSNRHAGCINVAHSDLLSQPWHKRRKSLTGGQQNKHTHTCKERLAIHALT